MITPERPDPDQLLARLERESVKAKRGRLKIFFGAAAGVGKTCAMLRAAHQRRKENLDIVVGIVETHGRKETQDLVNGLENLPLRQLDYKGKVLYEFDIDAAIKRRPTIILIDEMAHSNAPGSRHPKRWQDINELLELGINVYTALNVQHLESINDDVRQISGVQVFETVPDTVFEEADEVELVDLPPDELLKRLRDGKIYLPQQAKEAVNHFFRKGNLIALRELSLRQTAGRVNAQMLDYREDNAIQEVWQVSDKILVSIGPNESAEHLVRAGKQLSIRLFAEWFVVYVETPKAQKMSSEQKDSILRNLRLAEQLGAETHTFSATDITEVLIRFCSERNINKIVIGKSRRKGWKKKLLGSLVDDIIVKAQNINIYLLSSLKTDEVDDVFTEQQIYNYKHPLSSLKQNLISRVKIPYGSYARSLVLILLCSAVSQLMFGHFELSNLIMIYLLGVVFVSSRFGFGPSILASIFAVASFDFLFVQPYYSFAVADIQYLFVLIVMLLVSMVISNLMIKVRFQAKTAVQREQRSTMLYLLSKELCNSRTEQDVLRITVKHLYVQFKCLSVILFTNSTGRIVLPSNKADSESFIKADRDVAQWVFDHNEIAGFGTNTLPSAHGIYFPIHINSEVLGVLGISPINLRLIFLPDQQKLLDTFLQQIAHTLLRIRYSEAVNAFKKDGK